MHSREHVREVAKERFSYPLRPGLARSGNAASRATHFRHSGARGSANPECSCNYLGIPGSRCLAHARNDENRRRARPYALRPLVADAQQFHRPVRDRDPEGGADGALDQMDVAAMGADQFGGNRQPEPAAAGPAGGLERLEQMVAGLWRHAGAGVGNLDDRDRAFAAPGDADLHGRGVARGPVFQRLRRVAHEVEQHAEQLIGIGVDGEPALDRG